MSFSLTGLHRVNWNSEISRSHCLWFVTLSFFMLILGTAGCGPEKSAPAPIQNFDFEQTALNGWELGGGGHKMALDTQTVQQGKQSLCFSYIKQDIEDAYAAAWLPVESFRGKRLRVAAMLKTIDAEEPFSLWIRGDKGPEPLVHVKDEKGPQGTSEWKQYAVELNVPPETTALAFGVSMAGKGKAWVDDFKIETLPPLVENVVHSGIVSDNQGTPIQNAIVAVSYWSRKAPLIRIRTSKDGRFRFELPPNKYSVTASAAGRIGGFLYVKTQDKNKQELVIKLDKIPDPSSAETIGKTNDKSKKNPGIKYNSIKGRIDVPRDVALDTKRTYIYIRHTYLYLFCVQPDADGRFETYLPASNSLTALFFESPGLRAGVQVITPENPREVVFNAYKVEKAPEAVVNWMKKNAVPIHSPQPETGFTDLQPLKQVIGDAKIVGLGEATHGSREFNLMRHRIFEYLVKEMGFTAVGIEASMADAFAVNEYVLHGTGDPEKALAGMHFWTCNTREVLDMILWMRKYNEDPAHKKKLKFYGVDMQFSAASARAVRKYLEEVEPGHVEKVAADLTRFDVADTRTTLYKLPKEEKKEFRERIEALLSRFDKNKQTYSAISGEYEWKVARQHVRILCQHQDFLFGPKNPEANWFELRDIAMAENLQWIMNSEPGGVKLIYWAHNGHIYYDSYPGHNIRGCGSFLRKAIGGDYIAIGIEFYRGEFQAMEQTHAPNRKCLKATSVNPLPVGSYGEAMSRVGMDYFLLDLRKIPADGPVQKWFSHSRLSWLIGSIFTPDREEMLLHWNMKAAYDAVIYFHNTTRARPNRLARRPVFPAYRQ